MNEFILRKDAKQAQVLSEYNMRYSEDPNIVKVVKYLNYIDIDGEINNPHREKPSNYEVEMFMRFFEELELQMRNSRLKKEDVYYLFCYYAFKLHKNNDLRTFMGVTDYENSNNWIYYKKLMDNYKQFTNE